MYHALSKRSGSNPEPWDTEPCALPTALEAQSLQMSSVSLPRPCSPQHRPSLATMTSRLRYV
jgi:hypothetical protein